MNFEIRPRFLVGTLLFVLTAAMAMTLGFASTATAAQTYSMVGEWEQNRSFFVNIPLNGDAQFCVAATEPKNAINPAPASFPQDPGGCIGRGSVPFPVPPMTMAARFAFPRTAGQPIWGFKREGGGINGNAIVTVVTGAPGPVPFTIPPKIFNFGLGPGFIQSNTVMNQSTVVQLNTTFTAQGPASAAQAAVATSMTTVTGAPVFNWIPQLVPAVFQANAWSKDPGQAAGFGLPAGQVRGAKSFTWCPGLPLATCIAGNGGGTGVINGIIRYKNPGGAGFGGTMGMLLKGGGTTSVRFPSVPPPTTRTVAGITTKTINGGPPFSPPRTQVPVIAHLPFGGLTVFMNPQVQGVGYAFKNTVTLASANKYQDFMTSNSINGVSSGGGMITAIGPVIGVTAGDFNINWGMPWTTGNVSVMNVEVIYGINNTGTITAQGSDARTANGAGRITLIAGGTAHRPASTNDFENLDVITLDFQSTAPSPSMGPAGLSTIALLMALTAGYSIRRRFASSES